ncbi:unnamed protein product [Spirodela intermedia]|uniref:Uncharacterized protein n=1 Tax=Spirodela intermedia TaxID=51605 RepID=A0A7I8JC50_SPIIN|nr:unnamed protein product [Spirodela intermedia]CAA6667699.1 unnamed protein product [Spirodela intermedia]
MPGERGWRGGRRRGGRDIWRRRGFEPWRAGPWREINCRVGQLRALRSIQILRNGKLGKKTFM